MLARTIKLLGAAAPFVALVACQPAAEDVPRGSESGIVLGTDVHSPNANPNAAYLKGRRLENLTRLHALSGNLGRLAARADGTLDPTKADGQLTLEELLALEKDTVLAQLMPAERAVLPELWRLLETTKGDPSTLTVPPLDVILATEVSVPAGELVEPASVALASLKTEMQRVAVRLEQAHDSDDNPKTITKADIAAVLAAPAGFQPWEIAQIKTIEAMFRERAGTKLAAKARVTTPAAPPYTLPAAITWGPASIGIAKTIAYKESRVMDLTTGSLTVGLVGQVSQNVKITMPTVNQLLIIDDETGDERFASSGVLEIEAGTKTVEVWSGGARVGSFRATLPKLVAEETNLDLGRFADYVLVLEDGTPLKHVSVEGAQTDGSISCSFAYTKDGYDAYVTDDIKQGVANPAFGVAVGRYVLPTTGGPLTLELYPEGVFKVSRPDGWSERATYRNHVWTLPESSDLELSFDPATSSILVRKAGAVLFQGPLAGSLRTG